MGRSKGLASMSFPHDPQVPDFAELRRDLSLRH